MNAILQGRVNITPPVFHQGGHLKTALEESPPPISPTPLLSPVINRSQTVDFHWSQTQSLNSTPPAHPSPLPPIHPKPLSPFGGSTSSDDLPDPADVGDTFLLSSTWRPRSRSSHVPLIVTPTISAIGSTERPMRRTQPTTPVG